VVGAAAAVVAAVVDAVAAALHFAELAARGPAAEADIGVAAGGRAVVTRGALHPCRGRAAADSRLHCACPPAGGHRWADCLRRAPARVVDKLLDPVAGRFRGRAEGKSRGRAEVRFRDRAAGKSQVDREHDPAAEGDHRNATSITS
jgi:hypothetical protein